MGQTVDSVALYAQRYANHPAFLGFAVLNEPAYTDVDVLQDYYLRAYDVVRQVSEDCFIIINSMITPFDSGTEEHWVNFMNPDQGFTKVAMDLHYYHCYGGDGDVEDADAAIEYIKTGRRGQIQDFMNKNPKFMIIGEWSGCGHFDTSRVGEFIATQAEVYGETSLGWTFWSWTEAETGLSAWSLKTVFDQGWIDPIYPC